MATPPPAQALPAPVPLQLARQGDRWQTIQQRGNLRVGVKADLRPLGFKDSQGNWQGLEIELAQRLALELLGDQTALELVPVQNQDRLALLLNGEVDLIIAQLGQNPARDRLVDFSPPYYLDGIGLISKEPELKRLEQLTGQPIAVLQGSEAIAVVRASLPDAVLVGVDSYHQAYELLEQGQVKAFVGDISVLTGWAQTSTDYHQAPLQLSVNPLAIAMAKGLQHQALQQRVNQTMLELRRSGWLREQWQRWGLPQ